MGQTETQRGPCGFRSFFAKLGELSRLQLDPARGGQDVIQLDVMGFNRHFIDDLFIECDSARCPTNLRQQSIVKTFASTQPATMKVKGHSGNEDNVQLCWQLAAIRTRFADGEISDLDVAARVLDAAGAIRLEGGLESRQPDGFAFRQGSFK